MVRSCLSASIPHVTLLYIQCRKVHWINYKPNKSFMLEKYGFKYDEGKKCERLDYLLGKMGLERLTQDQEAIYNSVSSKKDTFVSKPAGTGKTIAALISLARLIMFSQPKYKTPIETKLTHLYSPRAFVIAPTLALAQTLYKKFSLIFPNGKLWMASGKTYENVPFDKYPDVFFCTPIQLLHITRGLSNDHLSTYLDRTEILVMDEVDSLMGQVVMKALMPFLYNERVGFYGYYITEHDEESIKRSPPQKLCLCTGFTPDGTLKEKITYETLPKHLMDDPVMVVDNNLCSLNPAIEHVFVGKPTEEQKMDYLLEHIKTIINSRNLYRVIIFVRSNAFVQDLYDTIDEYAKENIIGRNFSLDKVNTNLQSTSVGLENYIEQKLPLEGKTCEILIASDYYSRGLDFSCVNEVVHYGVSPSLKNYVHRTARTGRFGRAGKSTTIMLDSENFLAERIKKFIAMDCGKIYNT